MYDVAAGNNWFRSLSGMYHYCHSWSWQPNCLHLGLLGTFLYDWLWFSFKNGVTFQSLLSKISSFRCVLCFKTIMSHSKRLRSFYHDIPVLPGHSIKIKKNGKILWVSSWKEVWAYLPVLSEGILAGAELSLVSFPPLPPPSVTDWPTVTSSGTLEVEAWN